MTRCANRIQITLTLNAGKRRLLQDSLHRDLSIHMERPPPPSQFVHAHNNWVEAKLGHFAKCKILHLKKLTNLRQWIPNPFVVTRAAS